MNAITFKRRKQERFGSISHIFSMKLFRLKIGIGYHPLFDRHRGAERRVILCGFRFGRFNVSLLYQRYQPGYALYSHIDGPKHNHVLWFLLKRSQEGGELVIDGPHRSFLRGRIKMFDGGQQVHEVTEVKGSNRHILMLQVSPSCDVASSVD